MKVEYVDHMGTDLTVVNAARVSFNKESGWETVEREDSEFGNYWELELSKTDEKLINYLAKHNHWTPFAHTAISLRMQAPVPIRTQCFKHKAGFVENEESRRYVSGTPPLFVPEHFREAPEGSIKQGSGGIHAHSEDWRDEYIKICQAAIDQYEYMIRENVAPEQARFILPQGVEVQWIWTGNLASYARFYNQRTDPHAQKEVQDLAEMVGEVIEELFPVSWRALTQWEK